MSGPRCLLLVAVVSCLVAAPAAQQRPNFSGRWVLESPTDGAGQEQIVKHDAASLSTEHGSEGGSHRAVYKLDGTTSRNVIGSHGSEIVTESQGSWKGDRLTIASTTTYPDGRRRLATEVWSLDTAGKLVIEFKETIDGKSTTDVKLVFVKRTSVAPAVQARTGEAAAQRRPNFASTWTLIHEPGEPQRAGTFGDTDGQKLMVTTTSRGSSPAHVTKTQILWLDSDGALIVETSRPPDSGGGPGTTVRTVTGERATERRDDGETSWHVVAVELLWIR